MKRLLLTLSMLSVAGCSTYYSDPYYSDRYYQRRYDDRHDYSGAYDVGLRYGYASWYYDLYDPYSALFVPLGYLYDPWYWDSYRFGIHRYPSRFWSFSFYGGRPWYYSPWYGGYGIYHPYGYSHNPRPRRDGVPSFAASSGGESAQTAARGLAAEINGRTASTANALVRSSAVRVGSSPGDGSELLGTMATPGTTINGLPVAGNPYRAHVRQPGSAGFSAQQNTGNRGLPGRFNGPDGGIPMERAGFRDQGMPSGWRSTPRADSINGLPSSHDAAASGWESGSAVQGVPGGRPMTAADHPWRDAQPIGDPRPGMNTNWRGQDRANRRDSGFSAGQPRMERAFPSASPRAERGSFDGGSRGSSNGIGGGGDRPQRDSSQQ